MCNSVFPIYIWGRHIVFALSVHPSVFWTTWRILKLVTTNVHYIETMCRGHVSFNQLGSRSRSHLKAKCHMTIFCVRSITFEPLEGFWNYSPQMLTIFRQCTDRIFQPAWFKVKVRIRCNMTIVCVCSITFDRLEGFWKLFTTNVHHIEMMQSACFNQLCSRSQRSNVICLYFVSAP